jgi:hypothetical protein
LARKLKRSCYVDWNVPKPDEWLGQQWAHYLPFVALQQLRHRPQREGRDIVVGTRASAGAASKLISLLARGALPPALTAPQANLRAEMHWLTV